jgi:AAA+ ATPase superfamily predicted ATPase
LGSLAFMFHTSTPVTAAAFHDRVEALASLESAVDGLLAGAPRWVAILGPRKVGKTSLVLEATRRRASASLAVAVFDVQECGPVSAEVFRRLALRVVDALLAPELGESPEALARKPAGYRALLQRSTGFAALPPAVRTEVMELVEGEADADRAGAWLQLPESMAEKLGVKLVVAVDEFQDLAALQAGRDGLDPFALMRSRWQKHRQVAYFISGSARSMLLELVGKEHSPFFQHFSILELGPFSRADGLSLLLRHGPAAHPIPEAVATAAVEVMGGHPFYLQLLGETLTRQPRSPDLTDLKVSIQELVFSPVGRLGLHFENEFQRLVGRATLLAATLEALADGPIALTAVASRIGAASGATASYLGRLGDAVRRRDDGRYELSDPTFGLWLRWRQPGGTVIPMKLIGDAAEQAVAGTLAAMGFDLVYQSRASRGAFDLLALRGATQLGVQVRRRSLPLRFTRAEWSRMEAEAERLGWRWVVAAVDPAGPIAVLDPARAIEGREVRLDAAASIPNLLRWIDRAAPE